MSSPDQQLASFDDDADDVQGVPLEKMSDAVVTGSDWTTETILSQITKSNIVLSPRFQRRDAWDTARKSRFIESLVVGLPIPQIVLAEVKDKKGRYLVLDGKQRLLTLVQFTGQGTGKKNAFALRGLELRPDLNRKTYAGLRDDLTARDDVDRFLNQTIRSVVIRNWPSVAFLHTVFIRLNMGSVQLSPQELRQALFPGPFVDYADDRACESQQLRKVLNISEPDFRMRDVELLVRFLAFRFFLTSYSGDLKGFLDSTCDDLNEKWKARETDVVAAMADFEAAVDAGIAIFGNDLAKRWVGDEYQGRFNRAVFDPLVFYWSDERIRSASIANAPQVVKAFKELCSDTPEFLRAVEASTKTIGATHVRFDTWGTKLKEALSLNFRVPQLEGGRIAFDGFWL